MAPSSRNDVTKRNYFINYILLIGFVDSSPSALYGKAVSK